MKQKILIVDDEKMTRDAMARILGGDYVCQTAADGELALAELARHPDTALLLTDYKMPGMNGIELIEAAKKAHPALAAIIITAFAEVSLAVDAMKRGADDFETKPITDFAKLREKIALAIRLGALERPAATPEQKTDAKAGLNAFTGTSPALARVYNLVRRVAPSQATVLVSGPSGTGKELAARAIHDLSPRRKGPFIAVECAALSATLLESELFGSVKGSFTGAYADKIGRFEAADGGTLFLDEIGEIDLATQVKLLRVLETHTFQRLGEATDRHSDFRLVAATNRNLAQMVAAGTFREDLYYRLNVIEIKTPALREHPEDIAPLVARFIREFAAANGTPVTGLARDALAALEAYAWPGNVRQLRNVIERMTVLATGPQLTAADLPDEILGAPPSEPPGAAPAAAPVPAPGDALSLADLEKQQILTAIEAAGGNKSKAAERLGISRRTLHRKIKEWNLTDTP